MQRFVTLLLALSLFCGCASPFAPAKSTRGPSADATRVLFAMDTVIQFAAWGGGADEALAQAERELLRLEGLLSATKPESDVFRLNAAAGSGEWVRLAPESFDCLARSLALCEQSGGALDITVGALVRAWGIGGESPRVPAQEELSALCKQVDYRKLELDAERSAARLPAGYAVDLGAVAKGYASQRLIELLRARGIARATVSLGGNLQTLGDSPRGGEWIIDIQSPDDPAGAALSVFCGEGAVVTSGSYQRYFIAEGRRYHHLLDPATGAPAESGLVSVSVLTADGLLADALSSTLFILGVEGAERLYRERGDFEYILIDDAGAVRCSAGVRRA